MSPLRVLLVDDEPLAIDRLRGLLSEIPDTQVVGTASGCQLGIDAIRRHQPDLVLLDVKMRDGSAFDLLSGLSPGDAPLIVFSTAHASFACKAFEVNALDYLLKPVDPERLAQVAERARRSRSLLDAEGRARELERVVAQLREQEIEDAPRFERELWIRSKGTEHVRVPIASITRIAALDDYVSIYTDNGQEHLLRATLDRVSAVLDPAAFARIHRSSIVRRELIRKVVSNRTGGRSAILIDGTILPIGRTYAKQLQWTSPPAISERAPSPAAVHRDK